jgi:hypothetical protein
MVHQAGCEGDKCRDWFELELATFLGIFAKVAIAPKILGSRLAKNCLTAIPERDKTKSNKPNHGLLRDIAPIPVT